ncbi:hypothetical protein U1Q18_051773, partial [Sarracenia purpurea var. burkii]
SIKDQITKAGISKIFKNAEFDNLAENPANLQVSDVNHATEIQIDEDGTVASAVTSIELSRPSVPQRAPSRSNFT